MKLKKFLKFEKQFEIECPMSANEFRNAFKRRYLNDKKSEFKGEIGKRSFKLWLDRNWFRATDFSELNCTIEKHSDKTFLKGKVELSDSIITQFALMIIITPIIILFLFFSDGFDLTALGIIFVFTLCSIVVINLQLNKEKKYYIEEFNDLFYENEIKNQKHNL